MSFSLHVDAARWHANTDAVRDAVRSVVRTGAEGAAATALGDIVPVAKGNGYGLSNVRLARETSRLGVGCVAVGTPWEVAEVAAGYDGDLLVLTPFEPTDTIAMAEWTRLREADIVPRVIATVSSPSALLYAAKIGSRERPTRIVIEALTSMGRFGLRPEEIRAGLAGPEVRAAIDLGVLVIEGLALHLPLTQPEPDRYATPGARWHDVTIAPAWPQGATNRVREVLTWALGWHEVLGDVQAAGNATAMITALSAAPTLWISHLDDRELTALRTALPSTPLRVRVGTRLWLGDRGALVARGTVLAVHDVSKGERAGYRQRRAARDGSLLVIGGGTSHGVALSAPTPAASSRQRVVSIGSGVMEAGGKSLSPFTIAGKQRWFVEPPHMQVSLVRLPEGVPAPNVGDDVDCDVRLTTASFDRVIGLD